jgi:hypothetical protein
VVQLLAELGPHELVARDGRQQLRSHLRSHLQKAKTAPSAELPPDWMPLLPPTTKTARRQNEKRKETAAAHKNGTLFSIFKKKSSSEKFVEKDGLNHW